VAILVIFQYMADKVLIHEKFDDKVNQKESIKMSMRENFAILGRSKYLLSIAIIVLAYNIVINLIEVIWKDQVRQLYPDANDFAAYMSQITTITGIISFFLSLLVSGQLIRKFGWTIGALITPAILLITCCAFFFFFFGQEKMSGIMLMLGTSPLTLIVFIGSLQNCFSRASKFTLFDSTKEMAFIPLSIEDKLKGKAAIDGVGSRLGKSGGALIHSGLLLIFSTVSASAHFAAAFLFLGIFFWIGAVLSLGKQFNALTAAPPTPSVEEPAAAAEVVVH
jgi:ATP:ADP antiporter, AAA family